MQGIPAVLVLLLAAASSGPVAWQPASRPAEASASAPQGAYGRVELIRDTWGVAHVFAETDAGAMYGLGYACAEDRAFQMHYSLRIIQGRLAEVVGDRPSVRRDESAVFSDRKMRTFGFYRAAKAAAEGLDADAKAMLMAYCDGVNDSIAAHRDTLHPLFDKLGLKPEPWTPADCIASFWHLGQFFATDGTRELIHYRNVVSGGAGRPVVGRDGRPMTPPTPGPAWMDDESSVVLRSDVSDDWLKRVNDFLRLKGLSPAGQPASSPAGPKFSHAWVVGGKKTTTGSAVLVSDPQTPIRCPAIWQEFHVCGKTFNARGVGVPGCPGLLIGWNENVAWGVSALGADQADLFRLRTDADHPDQYFLDGKWRDMAVLRETIAVKGGHPTELVVRETVFGPVVTPFAFAIAGDPQVALKRVPVCSKDGGTFRAMLAMMRAKDASGFVRAISTWQFPSINLIFGDKKGDIGYWLLAAIPIRSAQDAQQGAAALDGTRSEMDWQGFVPHDLLPHVINPSRGWIASANHRPIGSFYPTSLGLSTGSAGHTVRSWRLYEQLTARERFEPNDVLDIHFDTVNPARREIVHAGLHIRDVLKRELSADATNALQRLDAWYARGAKSDLNQDGAELAGEINTFFRLMSTPLAGKYGGGESGLSRFLRDLQSRMARDAKAELSREEQQFIDQALAGAWQSALNRYGDDPARWNARARSAVTMRRIGAFDSLDGFGSLDAQADLAVPALTCVDGGTIKSQASQSYTQYVPLHDVDSARSLLPPGHSELPDNPLRMSTVKLWQEGELHPAPLSRQAVEKIASSHRTLRAELRKLGIAANTLLWFNSDNGGVPQGSTGNLRGKKGSVWEGGLRVPGIIEWPARIRKAAVTDVPAVTSDIYPTVLDFVGVKVPNQVEPIDGISLRPVVEGKMTERPKPIAFWHGGGGAKDKGHAALTDNTYKLHKLGPEKYELYDLVADPAETKDLAAEKPDVVARMKAALDAWQDSVVKSLAGGDYPGGLVPAPGAPASPDAPLKKAGKKGKKAAAG